MYVCMYVICVYVICMYVCVYVLEKLYRKGQEGRREAVEASATQSCLWLTLFISVFEVIV